MPVTVSLEPMVTIERLVFFACDGPPPPFEAIAAAGARWTHERVAPGLVGKIRSWDAVHPMVTGLVRREDVPDLASTERLVDVLGFGPREADRLRRATHAWCVQGRTPPTGEGWPGMVAWSRGVAAAFDGVIVDARTWLARPIDEHHTPLVEVPLTEATATISLYRSDRWLFRTVGLANLGLPDIWFDGVRRDQSAVAWRRIQGLRDALAARATAHLTAEAPGPLVVSTLRVPGAGEVPITAEDHPLVGRRSLRAAWTDGPDRVAEPWADPGHG